MTGAGKSNVSLGIVTGSMSRQAGGLFNSVRKSALNFKEAGISLGVHALRDDYSDEDIKAWLPIRPHVHSTVGPASLGYAPDLAAALNEADYDLLHLHGIWQFQSLAVRNWRRKTGKPVMISPRGMLDPWAISNSGWKKRLVGALFENENLHGADCMHALNASEAASMRGFGLKNPIAVIPNGTDLVDLDPGASHPEGERRTLLFLGRIHPKKGLDELIRAWHIASSAKPALQDQWQLVIAGWDDGGHEQALKDIANDLGLSSSISFVGPAYDETKDALLRQADCFILPSFSEGLPMSVLEAWSYALPVLMTEHCNLPEGFEKGAAIEVSTDSEALAARLGEALLEQELSEIGRAGRSLVEAEFAWPSIAAQHIAVYDWMLGRAVMPDCVHLERPI